MAEALEHRSKYHLNLAEVVIAPENAVLCTSNVTPIFNLDNKAEKLLASTQDGRVRREEFVRLMGVEPRYHPNLPLEVVNVNYSNTGVSQGHALTFQEYLALGRPRAIDIEATKIIKPRVG